MSDELAKLSEAMKERWNNPTLAPSLVMAIVAERQYSRERKLEELVNAARVDIVPRRRVTTPQTRGGARFVNYEIDVAVRKKTSSQEEDDNCALLVEQLEDAMWEIGQLRGATLMNTEAALAWGPDEKKSGVFFNVTTYTWRAGRETSDG